MKPKIQSAYIAAHGFVDELTHELGHKMGDLDLMIHHDLILSTKPAQKVIWADNVWLNPEWIEIDSIGSAVKKLNERGPLWSPYLFQNFRRAELIQEKLRTIKHKPLKFLQETPDRKLGSWTLLEPNLILASPDCTSPFPNGRFEFVENKKIPPSRAYLKLWEVMTVLGIKPKPSETCLDFGSCPGGWTWVLQSIGCKVVSVDRAELAPHIAALPRIEFIKTNAFTIEPQKFQKIDWFFSDIICYPSKLYELVLNWMESGLCENFVCTIKFQGETDFESIEKFKNIPDSQLIHLHHNKHEITWIKLKK